ncbi:MAG: GNAT family N-acetyltransferase [Planctomycetaceae bacterium]|nr:GNAT family N-acetyltransferase [Planctomycetaceae bacterium]
MKKYYVLETLTEAEIDTELDHNIRQHLALCFTDSPDKFQSVRVWHNTKPRFTIIHRDRSGRVLGHAALVIRSITFGWNSRNNVASLQGVSVDPDCRGTGMAQQLVARALEAAVFCGYPYAILFCKEDRVPFYQHIGWKLTDDSVVMRNLDDNPIKMRSNCPMYKVLGNVPFPEGPVDVHTPLELPPE